jgi:hypothetical protein
MAPINVSSTRRRAAEPSSRARPQVKPVRSPHATAQRPSVRSDARFRDRHSALAGVVAAICPMVISLTSMSDGSPDVVGASTWWSDGDLIAVDVDRRRACGPLGGESTGEPRGDGGGVRSGCRSDHTGMITAHASHGARRPGRASSPHVDRHPRPRRAAFDRYSARPARFRPPRPAPAGDVRSPRWRPR